MKQRWAAWLLCAAMLIALLPAAAAEDGEAGFYGVAPSERVEIVPLTADGSAAAGVVRDVDGSGEQTLFYPGSRALRVTLADAADGAEYLLTVWAGETALYAEQKAGIPPLVFDVSFSLSEQPTELLLNVGSTEPGFVSLSLPLCYTPSALPEPSVPDGPEPSDPDGPEPPAPDEPEPPAPDGPEPTAPDGPEPPAPDAPEPPAPDAPCPRDDTCPMAAFSDLDRARWYHDGVHWALENGIMSGVGGGRFDPDGTASRAMIVTVLHHLEGSPEPAAESPFDDVAAGQWYADAVSWAAENGIVQGYGNGTFRPDDNVTREQLAVILYSYAKSRGQGFTGAWMFLLDYPDASEISDWADEAMHWCVMKGIISGKDGHLVPGGDASRAEAATMLKSFRANTGA